MGPLLKFNIVENARGEWVVRMHHRMDFHPPRFPTKEDALFYVLLHGELHRIIEYNRIWE